MGTGFVYRVQYTNCVYLSLSILYIVPCLKGSIGCIEEGVKGRTLGKGERGHREKEKEKRKKKKERKGENKREEGKDR